MATPSIYCSFEVYKFLDMAGTFSQLYTHIVFAVKHRQNLIQPAWKEKAFKYIAGIIKAKEQKPIIVNGMPDHIHVFAGIKPAMRISDLVRDIKNNSSKFINESNFLKQKFAWQDGYGVFTCSHSGINAVYNYILNQESHHINKTFRQECIELFQAHEIPFQEKFLFEFYD